MSYKGRFRPKHPDKYAGDPTNIIYRSLWELRLMRYFDQHPGVLVWGSEELAIPYVSPVDNRIHRYYPDFIVKMRENGGRVTTNLIEVKPYDQTIEPKKNPSKPRRYISEVMQYGVNQAKWKAAIEFCADRMWNFRILTEKDIGVK